MRYKALAKKQVLFHFLTEEVKPHGKQNQEHAGLLIGTAVAAIELLSERLEEMKSDTEDIDMDIR